MILALLIAAAPPPLLVFQGNVAIIEDVYRALLDLPADSKATPASARSVAIRLRRFLHLAGYTLATVQAQVEAEQIAVQIDEGRLDKIIFLGGGAFETLRLRLDLHLHDEVFNKPELERQLKGLARRLGLSEFAYEIVPVTNIEPQQLQLDEIDPIEQLSLGLVRPGRPYELHILVQPGVFRPGISPDLEVNSLEGGGLGATYSTGRLLLAEDRERLSGRLAGALRQSLDGSGGYLAFTRLRGEAVYEAPPIAGFLRPSLRARVDLSNRQRSDLNLESAQFATLEGAALLVLPLPPLTISLGAGVERRLLFSLRPATGQTPPTPLTPFAHTRNFAEITLKATLDPEAIRRDRHHELELSARVYGAPHAGTDGALHLFARWQKMFAMGWNELWLGAIGVSRTGFVLFPEEESIGGDPLRGPFGSEYARRLVTFQAEYRYSLLRDVFKLGLFHNAVAYGKLDRAAQTERVGVADSFGLGVHALLIDEFELDAYFGAGFASGSQSSGGAALLIKQAF
jgi:hypothetical protein